jgi:glutamate 5-kinase
MPRCRRGKKRWILSVPVRGELRVDAGAVRAVRDRRKSLFSAGIVAAAGDFSAHDAVRICNVDGAEIGRALVNYTCEEVEKMKVRIVRCWTGK